MLLIDFEWETLGLVNRIKILINKLCNILI